MVQARLMHKRSWKKLRLQAVVRCMGRVCNCRKRGCLSMPRLGEYVSSSLLQIFSSDFTAWLLDRNGKGSQCRLDNKAWISSPKRNFPVGAGTWCCVSCLTHSLGDNQLVWSSLKRTISAPVTLVWFFLPLLVKKNVAQSGSQPNFSVRFQLGIFCPTMLWWISLGLFTGFLWASALYYPNGDLWESWMRPNSEKVAVLPKAIFALNKDDALPKMVQYEYALRDYMTKKSIVMVITVYFLITDFRFISPWLLQKILLFPRKQYLNISQKLIIAGPALDRKGLPMVRISNPQQDWIGKAESAQHFVH